MSFVVVVVVIKMKKTKVHFFVCLIFILKAETPLLMLLIQGLYKACSFKNIMVVDTGNCIIYPLKVCTLYWKDKP